VTAFRYEAARADGAVVKGVLDATSGPEAAAVLSGRGLMPLKVEAQPRPAARRLFGPSTRSLATVMEGLSALVGAGVPLEPALRATERAATPALGDALGRVATRVREGSSLGAALGAEDGLFPAVTIGLVRAGERGVGLDAGLAQAAAQLEAQAEITARIRAALTYPLLLALVGTLSVGLIVLFVVPRFAALLGELGQALPLATRLLLAASQLLRDWGLVLGVVAVAGALAGARLVAEHRARWHAGLLGLPLVGSIRHAFATARAARALGALLATGTPALAALAVAAEAAGDEAVAARLGRARDRVAEGTGLAASLEATAALAPTALQLIAIGEGSGRLPALLAHAAQLEERDAERRLKTLVTFLEPALILAFAGLVAFVAASLLQAVYALRPA
jgi:type II secretory pathway component PulF